MFVLSLSVFFAAAALAAYAYRLWSHHANHNRAVQILHWIEQFLCGQGHVTGIKWISKSEFEVPLRLASQIFNHASVLVKMEKPVFPWRKAAAHKEETVTFRADLDYRPSFDVELTNLRWFARSSKTNDPNAPGWSFERIEPVVMTTRLTWEKEVTAAFQSMMQVENKEDLQVTFRKMSPNFSVTLPLERITPSADMPLIEMLNTIATVPSTEV